MRIFFTICWLTAVSASVGLNDLAKGNNNEKRELKDENKKGSPGKPISSVPVQSPVKPVPVPKFQPAPIPVFQPVPVPKVQPVFFPTPVQPRSPFGCAILDTSKYFNLIARHSNMVANVDQGSTSDGARIVQWQSNAGKNDNWRFESVGNGYYRIIAEHSQKGLYGMK